MAKAIATAKDAISRANALTRLETVSYTPSAILIKVEEDVTPFLGERNVGKPAWRVEYPKTLLEFRTASPGFDQQFRKTYVVMLEAASGHLFFVHTASEGKPGEDMRPMPSCGVATEQLSNEEEVYDGYPDEDPKVDFLGALELILNKGVGSPFLAGEIHGAYVLHSRMGSKPKPAWAITLRGLPPFAGHGAHAKSVPEWQRNHMRNLVDAMTGQVLFATNSPQPE
jgi:hypothetical protein